MCVQWDLLGGESFVKDWRVNTLLVDKTGFSFFLLKNMSIYE